MKEQKSAKKEGKNYFIPIAFIMLILVIMLFLAYKSNTTGKAYDAIQLKSQVEQFVNGLPFSSMLNNVKFCIAIKMSSNETVTFEVLKSEGYLVTQRYCMDPDNSDITIRFLSYDKFLKYYNLQGDLKRGANIDYDFSPSIYVKPGGIIDSNNEFRDKYYGAVNYLFDRNEIRNYGMENLLYENLNKEQQDNLKKNLPAGKFKQMVPGALEIPLVSENSLLMVIILVVIVAILSIIIFVVSSMGKKLPPEIIAYVKKLRQMGYSDETAKQALKNAGWQPKDIEKALKAK